MATEIDINDKWVTVKFEKDLQYKLDKGPFGEKVLIKVVVSLEDLAKEIAKEFNSGGGLFLPEADGLVCCFLGTREKPGVTEVRLSPTYRQEFDGWK